MNELKMFSNEEFGNVRVLEIDSKEYFVASDVAKALGYKDVTNAIKQHCKSVVKHHIPHPQSKNKTIEANVIPEGDMYRLICNSKLPSAEKFESWVMDEVLPTIRKTGGYVNNSDLMVNTYFSSLDDTSKQLVKGLLGNIETQQKQIISLNNELNYKSEVINGLVEHVDIYKKKDIVNRIIKRKGSSVRDFSSRYNEMYQCFKELYHIDLTARCKGYNLKQTKKKDELSIIKYAEAFNHIDGLYEVACKLYESEVNELLDELRAK